METYKSKRITSNEVLESLFGEKDGIDIRLDTDINSIVITTSNNFDVYWMLGRKNDQGVPYASRFNPTPDTPDYSKAHFAVNINNLESEFKVKELIDKIKAARNYSKQVLQEHDDFTYVLPFDHCDNTKPIFKYTLPESGYCVGKVVYAGKYFAVLDQGAKEDKHYFQVIKTNAILSGAQEFLNRVESVERYFPMGEMRYISKGQDNRLTSKPYVPKISHDNTATNEVAQKPIPIPITNGIELPFTHSEKYALMAFAEHFGVDWKAELISDWNQSKYNKVPKGDIPILKNLSETLGVAGLIHLSERDLFTGTPLPDHEPQRAPTLKANQPNRNADRNQGRGL